MSTPSDNGSGREPGKKPVSTLRPPEWNDRPQGPRSPASLTFEAQLADPAVSRRTGPRAELASLAARMGASERAGDTESERSNATALARALVTRGAGLDTAIELGRRALLLGHDPGLREELAGWFAALGEPGPAAATLRPLVADASGADAARILTRIGVLLGRLGDAAGAADALFDAAREDPTDAVAPELQAGIGAWAESAVSAERAAEGYLEGFRRHEAAGDRAAAFEDLLRAFEMAPGEPLPAERLAGALAVRGRVGASDEVLREHARASGSRERAVHLRRLREAISAGDPPRALGAALDAHLEADLDDGPGKGASGLDPLAEQAGLHELRAARWELALLDLHTTERASMRLALARLYSGPLASPERAVEAWIECLALDPASVEAREGLLGELGATGDPTPLIGALLRVARGGGPSRRAALVDLAKLASTRVSMPGLVVWAGRAAMAMEPDDDLAELVAQSEPAARDEESRIEELRGQPESLAELAGLLRSRPDHVDEYLAVLRALLEVPGEHRGWQRLLERVLVREDRVDELVGALERALTRDPGADYERVALALALCLRARGEEASALRVVTPLLFTPAAHPAASGMALVLAARLSEARLWARALLRLAAPLSSEFRAVLLAASAEALLSAGDVDEARSVAEQASRADPSQARPVAVLATIALARAPDRSVADALERAMGFIVPRAALCEALADAHDALGDPSLALVWTQRWLALRPGDVRAARTLLGRVTEAGDGQRIGDALSWLLSQPQPLSDLASPLSAALLRLAEIEPARGTAMARRALDVLGPRSEELRETVLAVADSGDEPGLALALLERTLAVSDRAEGRVELLLSIATRRRAAGDADGVARALARAKAEGAAADRILNELADALPARSSDGEISLLTARAEALAEHAQADAEARGRAFRELGAALWDLAGDPDGAVQAWQRAAELDPVHGVNRLARDLVSFAGAAAALEQLERYAARQGHPEDASRLLGMAATVALGAGESAEALRIAVAALDLDPSHTDMIAIAERAAGADDVMTLESIYEKLSRAALGTFGERAVHYRAARYLERRGEDSRALDHAIRAFCAVPAEGITFVLMGRLAERVGRGADVVRTLTEVAEAAHQPQQRSTWLKRAALFGGSDEDSNRLRVDVLLRALSVRPEPAVLVSLGKALAELGKVSNEHREIGALRFEHALESLLPRLEGAEGARTGIAAAGVALDLSLAGLAISALERAAQCDAAVEWYSELSSRAPALAAESDRARALVGSVNAAVADKYGNVGRQLLELAAQIARALDDGASAGALVVAAAERDPDDAPLAARAALAAQLSGDPALLGRVASTVPTAERIGTMLRSAAQAERSGDPLLAIEAFERVAEDPAVVPDDRRRARLRLRELYGQVGHHDKLETLIESELTSGDLVGAALARAGRDLAALLATRGKPDRALAVLDEALRNAPGDIALLEDMVTLAHQARDGGRRAAALGHLIDRVDDRAKLRFLRELAPLLAELGDDAGASSRFAELSAMDPDDLNALAAMELAAEKRGDWERALSLLGRRASLASRVDDVRRIRLRRATLLEERLGRADEARTELEALLAATGDHLSVLRVLADLHQRLGAPLRAAPLWMRASAVTTNRDEAADLSKRACEAYLAGGDVDAARRVIEGLGAWLQSPELLELAVAVERRSGDARALGQALEDLVGAGGHPVERHVALLVEAARAYDVAGQPADALALAERASEIAPAAAAPQIFARWLEYRVRGPTTREHARLVVAALRGIDEALTPEEAEVRGFLIAEALDSAVGTGAGMRELMKLSAELGNVPLVALGIGERLTEGGEHGQSLSLFDLALSGDLRGVRHRGRVAIMAADAARETGDFGRALGFVNIAATEPITRDAASALGAQLRAEELAGEVAREQASARRDVAPVRRTDTEPGLPRAEPVPAFVGPRDSSPPPRLASKPPAAHRPSTTYHSTAPPEQIRQPSEPPPKQHSAPPAPVIRERGTDPEPHSQIEAKVAMPASLRRVSGTFAAASSMEADLLTQLAEGSLDAGFELVRQLENRRSRAYDLVAVCRAMVSHAPGDRDLLRQLYVAALADKNHVYARAVEHALALFDPSAEAAAPPGLAEQPEDPARLRALLFRELQSPVCEALSLVWEGASHVFRRDPASYGVAGAARISIQAPTPLARTYAAAARVLGLTRTPLFHPRTAGPISLGVALLSPPALIAAGEVARETPELSYHVGAMLVASLPEHVLLFGSSEEQAQSILKSMLLAFGPPAEHKADLASAASLAEVLWERIPASSQRRLRELCHEPSGIDFETGMAHARRAARRAGLFVSGDLGVALRQTCRQEGIAPEVVASPSTLAKLVAEHAAFADLVRLATSSEYSAARWQTQRGTRPPAHS